MRGLQASERRCGTWSLAWRPFPSAPTRAANRVSLSFPTRVGHGPIANSRAIRTDTYTGHTLEPITRIQLQESSSNARHRPTALLSSSVKASPSRGVRPRVALSLLAGLHAEIFESKRARARIRHTVDRSVSRRDLSRENSNARIYRVNALLTNARRGSNVKGPFVRPSVRLSVCLSRFLKISDTPMAGGCAAAIYRSVVSNLTRKHTDLREMPRYVHICIYRPYNRWYG